MQKVERSLRCAVGCAFVGLFWVFGGQATRVVPPPAEPTAAGGRLPIDFHHPDVSWRQERGGRDRLVHARALAESPRVDGWRRAASEAGSSGPEGLVTEVLRGAPGRPVPGSASPGTAARDELPGALEGLDFFRGEPLY